MSNISMICLLLLRVPPVMQAALFIPMAEYVRQISLGNYDKAVEAITLQLMAQCAVLSVHTLARRNAGARMWMSPSQFAP